MQVFFIVGAQKSGTTWLQRLLDSCPGIACFGESHFADRLAIPILKTVENYNHLMATVQETVYEGEGYYRHIEMGEYAQFLRQRFILTLRRTAGSRWDGLQACGDKTPAHAFHMKFLLALFPNARFIHMLRDGRDVAISNYWHRKRVLSKMGKDSDVRSLAIEAPYLFNKWHEYTSAVLTSETNGIPVHTVRYEQLSRNPLAELKSTISHIIPQASISEDVLNEVIRRNSFSNMSKGRKQGEANAQSFLRQGIAGAWKKEFSKNEISTWDPKALNLLNELGYR